MNFFKTTAFAFLVVSSISCICSQEKIEIVPFTLLNKTDTLKTEQGINTYKAEYFLVRNYKNDKTCQNYIDSFVAKNKAADLADYTQYNMIFYKESKITNPTHLKENPRDLDRYSLNNDWIYEYQWVQGKFSSRWKIKNGELVDDPANKIIITSIPPKDSL
jgi:hypothetical protein